MALSKDGSLQQLNLRYNINTKIYGLETSVVFDELSTDFVAGFS
jgi:ribosome-associated toxin RatA of RatAB toxin-antitoxin module